MDVPRFVVELLDWQGVRWHHQGRDGLGVDCVGLVLAGLAEQGIHVDAPADYHPSACAALLRAQVDGSGLVEPRAVTDEPEAGDLLVLRIRREAQHLGVALGDGRMIHATQPHGVAVVTMSALWRLRLVARYGWVPHG